MIIHTGTGSLLDVSALYTLTTGVMSFIVAAGGAFAVVEKINRHIHKADEQRDRLLTQHDKKITKHDAEIAELKSKLADDYVRLQKSERSSQITQEALFALIGHALDGNNIEELKQAQNDLKNYLIKEKK